MVQPWRNDLSSSVGITSGSLEAGARKRPAGDQTLSLVTLSSAAKRRSSPSDIACAGRATTPSTSARFQVHIEKGRGLTGDHARPLEAQLELTNGKAGWIVKDLEDAVRIRVTGRSWIAS